MDGFALLGSHLGDPARKVLTASQIRVLTSRMEEATPCGESRALNGADLRALGYGEELGERILNLLQESGQLADYLEEGKRLGCHLLTRGEDAYPALLRKRLGGESPCCFFYKGDPGILRFPAVSLVGSRNLAAPNRKFAAEAGRQAAIHGLTLVSGNARGADQTAQEACLEAGGRVISIVADELYSKEKRKNILYLSQEDWDLPFSSQRALSRNHAIHGFGCMTLVAQCDLGVGGTWNGTVQNLRHGWSPVACFRDGSPAMEDLQQRGAYLIDLQDLHRLTDIRDPQTTFFKERGEP